MGSVGQSRLELYLSATFSFADHHVVIRDGFRNCWPTRGSAVRPSQPRIVLARIHSVAVATSVNRL